MKKILCLLALIATTASARQLQINACWPASTTLSCLLPVGISSGGTGVASLTTNSLVLAQGSSAFTVVTADTTTTHILHGGTPPSFTAITSSDLPAITQSAAGVDASSGQRLGTNTNDSASAGNIGEEMRQTRLRSASNSISTGSTVNVTSSSITLTAGDWDVDGMVGFTVGASTIVTNIQMGIATTTATIPASDTFDVPTSGEVAQQFSFPAGNIPATGLSLVIPPYRISVASTQTIFLVAQATFSASTASVFGSYRARRVR